MLVRPPHQYNLSNQFSASRTNLVHCHKRDRNQYPDYTTALTVITRGGYSHRRDANSHRGQLDMELERKSEYYEREGTQQKLAKAVGSKCLWCKNL